MGLLRLSTPGFDYQAQQTITQGTIAVGAGTFAATNNIGTITFAAAHGLTLTPAAGVPPNYFVSVTGATAQSGVGTLNGNIFRLLAIPSTTTIQIYTTVTAATVTAASVIPIFFCPFTASPGTLFSGPQPTMLGVAQPPPNIESGLVYAQLGSNLNIRINSDNTFSAPLDPFTTPASGTPATAPTWTVAQAVSTSGMIAMMGWTTAVWATAAANSSTFSVMN